MFLQLRYRNFVDNKLFTDFRNNQILLYRTHLLHKPFHYLDNKDIARDNLSWLYNYAYLLTLQSLHLSMTNNSRFFDFISN